MSYSTYHEAPYAHELVQYNMDSRRAKMWRMVRAHDQRSCRCAASTHMSKALNIKNVAAVLLAATMTFVFSCSKLLPSEYEKIDGPLCADRCQNNVPMTEEEYMACGRLLAHL